jgi:hypothetical protein
MTLPLSPELLGAAYRFLLHTPPFKTRKMPPSSKVKFIVARFRRDYASYQWDGKQHTIRMSINAIGHTSTLLKYLGHEMVHLYLEENGLESRAGGQDTHNAEFKKLAKIFCRYHGCDPKAFY